MVGMDAFASAFGFDAKSDDVWTTLGKVTAVNGSTLSVLLGGSATPTECEAYCLAEVGDIVFVAISKGRARAIAVKGGDAFLPLDGGSVNGSLAVSGYLSALHAGIDATQADNGVTANTWPQDVAGADVNGNRTSFFGEGIYPDGRVTAGVWAYNFDENGTQIGINSLSVGVRKDGTKFYGVDDPSAFRKVLALSTWDSVTAANWYSPGTGMANTSNTTVKYNAALGIVQVRLQVQATSALSAGSHNIGTVASSYRPSMMRICLPSLTSASYPVYIDTNGTMTANTASVSQNGYLYYCGEYHIGG